MDVDSNMLDADTVENIPPSTNTVTHKHLHRHITTVLVNTHKCQKKGLRSQIEFKMTDK